MTKRANTLDQYQMEALLNAARSISSVPESAELRVLLSYFAGLRAAEIANLPIDALLDAGGNPARVIQVYRSVGKFRKGRVIPMHDRIATALRIFQRRFPNANYVAISRRSAGKQPYKMSPNAVTVWFHRLYQIAGFKGCSSHSGRRSFATQLAQRCGATGNTLVDVQRILGHEQLTTTQAYIQASDNIWDLVASLGQQEAQWSTRRDPAERYQPSRKRRAR